MNLERTHSVLMVSKSHVLCGAYLPLGTIGCLSGVHVGLSMLCLTACFPVSHGKRASQEPGTLDASPASACLWGLVSSLTLCCLSLASKVGILGPGKTCLAAFWREYTVHRGLALTRHLAQSKPSALLPDCRFTVTQCTLTSAPRSPQPATPRLARNPEALQAARQHFLRHLLLRVWSGTPGPHPSGTKGARKREHGSGGRRCGPK